MDSTDTMLAPDDLMEEGEGQADACENGLADGDRRGHEDEGEAPTLEAYTGDKDQQITEPDGQQVYLHRAPSPWNALWWLKAKAEIFAADQDQRGALILGQAQAVGRAIAGMPNLSKAARDDEINNAEWLFRPLAEHFKIEEIGKLDIVFRQALSSGLPFRSEGEIPAFLSEAGIRIGMRPEPKPATNRDDEEEPGSLADPLNPDSDGIVDKLPPAPLDLFTDEVRLIIDKVSETKSIPKEMTLSIVLALASACIGRSRGVWPRKDWKEHGHLFMILIAESGSGKSHAFKYIFKDLLKAEAEHKAKFKQACRLYLEEMGAYRKSKDPNKKLPEKPANIQYLLDDATIEAAGERLEDNPKGLVWSIDEMSGFFSRLDRYVKSGGDAKNRLLSCFNAETWSNSRKSKDGMVDERYHAKASIGIFGGIQPHLLNSLFTYDDVKQGLPQRFLYVRAVVDKPLKLDTPDIPVEVDDIIERITRRLLSLEMEIDPGGNWQARYLSLDPNARKAFIHFGELLAGNAFKTEASTFAVKLVQMTLRIALILHHLEWASKPAEIECPKTITYDTMTSATKLAEWLASHTEIARRCLPGPKGAKKATAAGGDERRENILAFIKEHEDYCREYHSASDLIEKGLKFAGIRQLGMYLSRKEFGFPKQGTDYPEYRLFPLPKGF